MQIQTEVRSGAESTRQQILSHARRAAHVGLDDHVRDNIVLLRPCFLRKHALVQPVVQARKFARFFGGYQVDALDAGGQMFRVAQIPPEAEKVVGESQHQSLHLRTGVAANFL